MEVDTVTRASEGLGAAASLTLPTSRHMLQKRAVPLKGVPLSPRNNDSFTVAGVKLTRQELVLAKFALCFFYTGPEWLCYPRSNAQNPRGILCKDANQTESVQNIVGMLPLCQVESLPNSRTQS